MSEALADVFSALPLKPSEYEARIAEAAYQRGLLDAAQFCEVCREISQFAYDATNNGPCDLSPWNMLALAALTAALAKAETIATDSADQSNIGGSGEVADG